MRRAVVASVLLALASPAAASPALIDRDADVVLVGSPVELAATLASIGKLASLHAMTIGFGRRAAVAELGWDPGDPSAWRARGFDPDGEIWLALSVGDGADRYRALTSAAKWTPKTGAGASPAFWRVRVIAPVSDARAARATLAAITSGLRDVEVVTRVRRGLLVADVLRPMFSGAGAPVSAREIRAAASDPPVKRRFDRAGRLAGPGLRAWLRGGGLIDIGRAMQRELHIEIQRDTDGARGSGPWKPNPRCAELAALSDGHLLSGLALAVRPERGGLIVDIDAVASSPGALARAFPVRSAAGLSAHRLPGLTGAAVVRLSSLAGLRALPRPPAFGSFTDALAHARGCEWHYGWTARLFGWPHLIGLFADEIAALGPRGSAIAAGVSTAAAGIASWDPEPLKMVAVLEGLVAGDAVPAAISLLDLAFARSRTRGGARVWGRGRMRPYLIARPGQPARFGTSLGGDAGVTLLGERRQGPGWPGGPLLDARFDLRAAGAALRRWVPELAVLGDARALELTGRVDGTRLRARIRLRR